MQTAPIANEELKLVARLVHRHGLGEGEATALFARLVAFLDAAAEHPQRPTPDVDLAWHEFILHTRDYAEFCHRRYGRFIHHEPHAQRSDCGSISEDDSGGLADCGSSGDGGRLADCGSGPESPGGD